MNTNQERKFLMGLLKTVFTEAEFNGAGNLFMYSYGRRAFRCDHYYEDGSCYGGPDGGGCSKRKKREELVPRPPGVNSNRSRSRSLVVRQRRQTDDVIGCQKESTKGVDYRGRAAETVDGDACLKWTEGYGGEWADDVAHMAHYVVEHNFCRNPNDDPNGVWCTTSTNSDTSSIGYCNVPKCEPVITTRDVSCSEWHGGRAYWKWDYEIPDTCESEFDQDSLFSIVYNVHCNLTQNIFQRSYVKSLN